MNELQLIRRELAAQRRHVRAITTSLSTQSAPSISVSYKLYFSFIIAMETRRLASHLERLRSRTDLTDADLRLIERGVRTLEALGAERSPGSCAERVTSLSALVEELEGIAESRYGLNDWRRAAHLDADSILEERRLREKALEQAHGRISG